MRLSILPAALLSFAAPAAAAEPVHMLIADTAVAQDGQVTVDLLVLNEGATASAYTAPATLPAELTGATGLREGVILAPVDGAARQVMVPAGGFTKLRYRGILPAMARGGVATIAIADGPGVALRGASELAMLAAATPAPARPPASGPVSTGSPRDNPFLPNLSAYEPIYFVYGPGTDTSGRVQISFKYRLFGRDDGGLGNLYFAYTQRMFWDLEADSAPFRDVNYMPELMYLFAPRPFGGTTIGGRVGARHESNGRSGAASRSVNTLYVQPEANWSIGGQTLTVAPRLWVYVGRRNGNEDIRHYRGNTGLYAALGNDNGLRVSLTSRLNPGSGKGAVDATVSYPLPRLWARGPQLYLIAQGFTGYGEDLLDYNRHQTRARIGFGVTR